MKDTQKIVTFKRKSMAMNCILSCAACCIDIGIQNAFFFRFVLQEFEHILFYIYLCVGVCVCMYVSWLQRMLCMPVQFSSRTESRVSVQMKMVFRFDFNFVRAEWVRREWLSFLLSWVFFFSFYIVYKRLNS